MLPLLLIKIYAIAMKNIGMIKQANFMETYSFLNSPGKIWVNVS